MSNKKKKVDPTTDEVLPTVVEGSTPTTIQTDVSVDVFDKASLEAEERRHETTHSLFDKAAAVIESYLEDPNADISAKMFPAKLAMDVYMAQEKFKREDQRIEIEKRKLTLEEIKVQKTVPNLTFNQQNNYISSGGSKPPETDLTELKKKQDQLLASYLPPADPNKDKKD